MVDRIAGVALAGALVAGGLIAFDGWASMPTSPEVAAPAPAAPAPPGSSSYLGPETDQPDRTEEPATQRPAKKPKKERPGTFRLGKSKVRAEVQPVPESGTGLEVMPTELVDSAQLRAVTVDFTVGSFNVFGSSHTAPGGKRPDWPSGVSRIAGAAELIRDHQIDVVGLQELQPDQMNRLTGLLGEYGIFPGPSMSWRESENSIIWRADEWYPVQSSTVAIPYFGGKIRQMPYIRLRNSTTGTDIWVANFHNPANTGRFGNQARWRVEATRRQIALANELHSRTGIPVVFTGDFNDRGGYFCPVVAGTELRSSTGGSSEGGSCSPPPNMQIDWVFGTPEITWTGSVLDRTPVARRVSDHPLVLATGRLNVVDQEVVEEAAEVLERIGSGQPPAR